MRMRDWSILCAAAIVASMLIVAPGVLVLLHEPFYVTGHRKWGMSNLDLNELITGVMCVLIWLFGLLALAITKPGGK